MRRTKVAGMCVARVVAMEGKLAYKHGVGTGILLVVATWPEEARARPALATDIARSWELDDGEPRQWSSLSVGTERFRRGRRSR